jgi:hypothetical protein
MRKGFFASVAALAASAGVALGQGFPSAPPPGYQDGPGPGAAAPGGSGMSYYGGGPGGPPAGPMDLPPAGEMPLYGPVEGPNSGHPINPAAVEPKHGMYVGQVHKAAGGPDRWFFDIEDMVWAIRSQPLPYPLLTSGLSTGAGIVGANDTKVLVGDHIDYGKTFYAGRLTFGAWDCDRRCGWEMSGFLTEGKTEQSTFTAAPDSRVVIARPVIDAITGQATSLLVAFPGAFGGSATVDARIHMSGAEANALRSLIYCDQIKMNVLAGVRYLSLEERLQISSTTQIPTIDPNDPTISFIRDQFGTRNYFLGGQLGVQSELRRGRFFVDMTGKVAAGNMNERVTVNGLTQRTVTGITTATPAGLLALGSNSGAATNNEFAYVPEGTIKFGYQWTQRISTYIGANAIYLSKVVRPGDQIDPVVNPAFVPVSNQFGAAFGPGRPTGTNNTADFWTMGATFGLCIRY